MSSTTQSHTTGAFVIYFGMLAVLGAFLAYGVYAKPVTPAPTALSQSQY